MTKILRSLFVAVMVAGAYCAGSVGEDEIIDSTGRTSIVLHYDDPGNWCELRGPARFTALSEIEGVWECTE